MLAVLLVSRVCTIHTIAVGTLESIASRVLCASRAVCRRWGGGGRPSLSPRLPHPPSPLAIGPANLGLRIAECVGGCNHQWHSLAAIHEHRSNRPSSRNHHAPFNTSHLSMPIVPIRRAALENLDRFASGVLVPLAPKPYRPPSPLALPSTSSTTPSLSHLVPTFSLPPPRPPSPLTQQPSSSSPHKSAHPQSSPQIPSYKSPTDYTH